jgi:hypothetical protein
MQKNIFRGFDQLDKSLLRPDAPQAISASETHKTGNPTGQTGQTPAKASSNPANQLTNQSPITSNAVEGADAGILERESKIIAKESSLAELEKMLKNWQIELNSTKLQLQEESQKNEADKNQVFAGKKQIAAEIERNEQVKKDNYRYKAELDKFATQWEPRREELQQWEQKLRTIELGLEQREGRIPNLIEEGIVEAKAQMATIRRKLEVAKSETAAIRTKLDGANSEIALLKQSGKMVADSQSKHEKKVVTVNKKLDTANDEISELRAGLQSLLVAPVRFNNIEIIRAIISLPRGSFQPPVDIAVVGDGPFDDKNFCSLLRASKYKTWDRGCECLVIGRGGWTEQQLEDVICDDDLEDIRVYSQELFILGMLTGKDPLDIPVDLLNRFADDHPALGLLAKNGFEWPSLETFENLNKEKIRICTSGFEDESPLADSSINYHVGESGIRNPNMRHRKLEKAFSQPLRSTSRNEDYIRQWGPPNSRRRLWRMANHLSWCVSFLGSRNSMETSVDDWLVDLEWLKERYYSRFMRFRWPR